MLTLNGNTYSKAELEVKVQQRFNQADVEEWERAFWKFIGEWISNDTEVSLQTSGTTGPPKTIKVTKAAMRQSAEMTAAFFGYPKGDSALLCLPATYIAGKMMIVRAFVSGLNLIVVPPSKEALLQVSQTLYFAPVVPMQAQYALRQGSTLTNIQHLLIGGAALTPYLQQKLPEIFPAAWLSYGTTETLTHVALKSLNAKSKSALFHALPGIHFTTDAQNQLVIHAPHIKNPVHTSDIVELQSATAFEWKGRSDNVINSGGIKLHPEAIEAKIQHLVSQPFFVTGLPDKEFGQKAVLVLEDNIFLQNRKSQWLEPINQNLHPWEKLWDLRAVPHFQRTKSGKFKRSAIRDELVAQNKTSGKTLKQCWD